MIVVTVIFFIVIMLMIRLQFLVIYNDTITTVSTSVTAASLSASRSTTTATTSAAAAEAGAGAAVTTSNSTKPSLSLSLGPFCLIHVGKTAGGTVSCRLMNSGGNGRGRGGRIKLAKSCPTTMSTTTTSRRPSTSTASSILSKYVVGKFHKSIDWGCIRNYNNNRRYVKRGSNNLLTKPKQPSPSKLPLYWLLIIRNPINRIISWYEYEHPQNTNVNEIIGNRPLLYEECYSTIYDLSTIGLEIAYSMIQVVGTTIPLLTILLML